MALKYSELLPLPQGSLLVSQGRYAEGIAHLRRALALLPAKDTRRESVSGELDQARARLLEGAGGYR